GTLLEALRLPLRRVHPHSRFPADNLEFRIESFDTPAAILDHRWHRVLADADARGCSVEQTDRLVRELAGGNIAMCQSHRCIERLVEDLHAMMLFHRRSH